MSVRDTALVIVDFQNDFTIGALPNPRGPEIAEQLNTYMRYHVDDRLLIASRDAHVGGPEVEAHFANYGPHCVKGTNGYQFFSRFQSGYCHHFVEKGTDTAAPSAFEGKDATGSTLNKIIESFGIRKVEICGFVAEICVLETIRDSIMVFGFETTWLPGLTAAFTPGGHDAVAKQVAAMGGHIR